MAEKRNKLEVTVLPQNFTQGQQNQARTNISAAAIINTVSEIKSSDGTVSATTGRNPDGSLYYNLKVSATPIISDTEIHGNNGISAKKEPNSVIWNIGLSADYLSANALTNLSGNWQNTYSAVSSNSASWNETSAIATSVNNTVSNYSASWGQGGSIPYSGKDGIEVTEDYYIRISANYLSANALDNISGNWNETYTYVTANSANIAGTSATVKDVSATVKANSGNWNSAYNIVSDFDFVDVEPDLWNSTYSSVHENSATWNNVINKLDSAESANYMKVSGLKFTPDDKISAYEGHELYAPTVTEYSGKDGIKVEDYWISVSGKYLSANALDNLSGNWDDAYDTLTANSATWDNVSAKLDTTAFSAVSGNFADKQEVEDEFNNTSAWANATFQPKGNYLSASEQYLSANALDNLSGNWEDTYNTVNTNSAEWTSAYNTVSSFDYYDVDPDLWNSTYSSVHENSATWNGVTAKLNKNDFETWSAQTNDWDKVAYSGTNGIDVENHIISISANYLSANALNDFSGKWEESYTTLTSTSGNWNEVSAKLDKTDFETWSADADITPYSGTNGIKVENHVISVSAEYALSADVYSKEQVNGLIDNVEELISNYGYWECTGNEIKANGEPDENVLGSEGYLSSTKVYLVKDNTATGIDKYKEWIWVVNEVEPYWKCIGDTSMDLAPYLKISAISGISGNWNTAYTYVTANSANIAEASGVVKDVSATVNANSAAWNEASAFSANSGKFVTSGNEIADDKAYVLTNNGTNVTWSGIDLSDLGKMYPINSLTPDLVSATISAVNGTSAYILSAKEPEEYEEYDISASMMSAWTGVYDDTNYFLFKAPDISGYSGISAKYITTANKWDIGLTDDEINIINSKLDTTAFSTVSGNFATKQELHDELEDTSAWANATFQPIGDYLSASNHYLSANALDNLSGNWNDAYDTLTANSATWNEVSSFNNTVITSTDESVGITATTVDNTVTYDLSVPPAEITDISGRNGISAYYDENEEKYIVEMEKSNLVTYGKFHTTNNTYVTSAEITGFAQDDYIGTDIYLDNAEVYANSGLYHVDMQVEVTIPGNDNTYYNTTLKATTAPVRQIQQEIDGSYAHTETISLSYDIRIAADATKLAYTIENLPTNATFFVKDLNIHRVICSLGEIGGSIYQASSGLLLQNDTFSVDIGDGLEFTGNQIQTKLGDGLKFDENANIDVNISSGLELNNNQIQAKLGDGLKFDEYSAFGVDIGSGLGFSGNQIQAKLGDGLMFDQSANIGIDIGDGLEFSGNQVQVKLGEGLKFDENAGVGVKAITINNQVEEVVDTVTTIASDLDTKITNNFPPAMITIADADISEYRNNGCLYGSLFSVNINSEVYIDRSLVGLYVYRVDNNMDVMFGIYEYQPDYPRYTDDDPTQGISGYGRTVPLCDTGVVTLTTATKGFCEFPIKNLNNTIGTLNPETRASLKSSCMYYATIYLGSNLNANGLRIGSFSGYTPQFNDIKPGLTIKKDNINCNLTADYASAVSFNDFGFSWKYDNYTDYYAGTSTAYTTADYTEVNNGYRFYMQLRNKALED